MFRPRAVRQLLTEDVAGLASRDDTDEEAGQALERARRRAITVAVVDWIAIIILVVLRSRNAEVFTLGPTEDSIFSIGILAVAIHSGFRLGQYEKLSAVSRVVTELDARSEDA